MTLIRLIGIAPQHQARAVESRPESSFRMLGHSHLLCSIFVFLVLYRQATWCLQMEEELVTGDHAENQFLYQGNPVHPFCIDFPQEGASRSKPMDLAACTETTITPSRDDEGWLTAEHRESEQMPHGYASYKVLAKKKSKFLVGTTISDGGSGIFDSLMWLELTKDRLAIVKEEPGGDRCAGGMGGYSVDGGLIRFSRSVTPADIVELSGIKADDVRALVEAGLEQSPASCFGLAHYEYDLKNEVSKLLSVHLHTGFVYPNNGNGKAEAEWTRNANRYRYQPCFNRLFNEYIDGGKSDLNLIELKEFGEKFRDLCIAGKSQGD